MSAAGKCVAGMERTNNEDAIYLSNGTDRELELYIVADGIGGHACGEVASSDAIEAFLQHMDKNVRRQEEELLDLMLEAVHYANIRVHNKGLVNAKYEGMGTTFTAAAIKGDSLYAAHVGDSRIYLVRNGEMRQLTRDHSYVMELVRQGKLSAEDAKTHPRKNVITRALGTGETVEVDTLIEKLQPGDRLLLCSDGLTNMLEDSLIADVLCLDLPVEELVDTLVDMANANGGEDNISVIVIEQRR